MFGACRAYLDAVAFLAATNVAGVTHGANVVH
jgi:hypothetical protein